METEEDVQLYLTLLADVERYLNEALTYTQNQARRGYFLQDETLDSTLAEIDRFVEKVDDNALIVNFEEKLDAINSLSDEQRQRYANENETLMKETYLPSYRHVREELEALRGSAKGQGGLAAAYGEQGRAYYELLMQAKTRNRSDDHGTGQRAGEFPDSEAAAHAGAGPAGSKPAGEAGSCGIPDRRRNGAVSGI